MNTWTGLFVNLNGQMKKIGNVDPSARTLSLYSEGYQHYETETLYFVNSSGEYKLL